MTAWPRHTDRAEEPKTGVRARTVRTAESRAASPRAEGSHVAATSTALPDHHYSQSELAALAAQVIGGGARSGERTAALVSRFFSRVGVGSRRLALPLERYVSLGGLEARSAAWLEVATELGERAIARVLDEAGLSASDIDLLVTTTVTGIAVPSLDARLMNRLPFRASTTRMPLFGLGCLGGAAGLARAADYLRAYPERAAILLSVELCSLTFQAGDASIENLVSTGLFGDGAAAVLLVGPEHRRALATGSQGEAGSRAPNGACTPEIVASRSVFFPNTERVMGWDIVDTGFKVVLSADVPRIVRENVPPALDGFLAEHGLSLGDVGSWVVHPGGPKVIDALEETLGLPPDALALTRDGLSRFGNLSSASVLFLLDEHRRTRPRGAGEHGILMAMGPAFCAEIVLFRWSFGSKAGAETERSGDSRGGDE
jgi:alkylresorcinol/alkylpyrone synthase